MNTAPQVDLLAPRLELYHGGCEHLFRGHKKRFKTIFADPPYNTQKSKSIAMQYTVSKALADKKWVDFHSTWDDDWPTPELYYYWTYSWIEAARYALTDDGSIFICGSHHNDWAVNLALKSLGFYVMHEIAWIIRNAMPHLAGKRMASSNQTVFWARKTDKYTYDYKAAKSYNGGKNLRDYWDIPNATHIKESKHPSKKPPALMQRAFDISTEEGASVCDPFAGSGRSWLGALGVSKVKEVVLFERETSYIEEIVHNYTLTQESYGKWTNERPKG